MDYEVILLAEARRVVRELELEEKELLAQGLRSELTDQPGDNVVALPHGFPRELPSEHTYFACALPGYVPIYRRMTGLELLNLAAQKSRGVALRGFLVFDIIVVD